MSKRPQISPSPEPHLVGRWFAAARREGLLALLAADAWQTLSAILSFTGRDNHRSFTLDQLGVALGVSREEAGKRLEQLVTLLWHGQPLASLDTDQEGAVTGARLDGIDALARLSSQPFEGNSTGPVEAADLRQALAHVGLEPMQVEHLLRTCPAERIGRQLAWLPAREARNPAALLIRAIEQDWEAPKEAA